MSSASAEEFVSKRVNSIELEFNDCTKAVLMREEDAQKLRQHKNTFNSFPFFIILIKDSKIVFRSNKFDVISRRPHVN